MLFLERIFRLRENGTTPLREVLAGLTTFAAMAYILAVNPDILSVTGMDRGALITATALGAAISTALMALMTNFPLALAPGMGINAYFAYTICLKLNIPWQQALGMVFVNGIIFLLLSLTGVRARIVRAIPYGLKIAVTCGLGVFIAFIGLQKGGLVVSNSATLLSLGDTTKPATLLFLGGFLLTAILVVRRVPGGIVIAVAVTTIAGLWVPDGTLLPDGTPQMVTSLPERIFSAPASLAPTAFQLKFDFLTTQFWVALPVILTLLLVDMFDNIGTLIGVTKRAGLMQPDGTSPRIGRALTADSVAAIFSSLLGTSTVVSYVESASGVEAGGRTGLTGLTTAACFLLALFLTPLILIVPQVAVAPVLVMVGLLMFEAVVELNTKDTPVTMAAVMTIIMTPLGFSISAGVGMGLIVLVVLMTAVGRARELSVTAWVLALVFTLHFFDKFFVGK
ncbi:MAG: NCS2 family permease [Puniceicoccales bacterium]|jgi:AGZA family xanthine/uracil permease-like MFS transporter|nr:NCS2 family permease [Puniceicoccales bacterium]